MARPIQDAPKLHDDLQGEILAHYRAEAADNRSRVAAHQGRLHSESLERTIACGGNALLPAFVLRTIAPDLVPVTGMGNMWCEVRPDGTVEMMTYAAARELMVVDR